MVDSHSLKDFHEAASRQRELTRREAEQQVAAQMPHHSQHPRRHIEATPTNTISASGADIYESPLKPSHSPQSHPPPSRAQPHSSPSTPTRPSSASPPTRPTPTKSVRMYSNEEVLLFRVPSDASHLILFNLPTKPFIHPYYDLRTVAIARREAEEAMRRERGEIIPEKVITSSSTDASTNSSGQPDAVVDSTKLIGDGSTTAALTTAAPTPALAPAPTPVSRPTNLPISKPGSSPSIITASAAMTAASLTPTALAASYHAAHLQNIERVLHSIANKFGLIYELSVHCKPRVSFNNSTNYKRFDDDLPTQGPMEEYEAGFTLWAWVKYYSVLHAGVAVKGFNRIKLGGQRLKAKFYERQLTKLDQTVTPTPATSASESSQSATSNGRTLTPYFPLSYHRCLDVCNYFLGFNNWTCEIKEIRRYQPDRDEELMDGQDSAKETLVLFSIL